MRIVPAVDIRGGLCVNLVQGDYDQETVFSEDPVAQARSFWDALRGGLSEEAAAQSVIHIVDLDGAKAGRCCVEAELHALTEAGIPFEVGGGIRNMQTLESIFAAGAARAILGTAAHRDPDFLAAACAQWPGKIVVGLDARDGKVALSGWLEATSTSAVDFARQVESAGAGRIIYTDILSDGMMKGPNYEATAEVAEAVSIPVTISGGVSSLDNIRCARSLEPSGVDEIIIGRALYLEVFTVEGGDRQHPGVSMEPQFSRVTLIGVGLLGASLGLALKAGTLANEIIGVGRRESSLKKAIEKGAIDRASLDPSAAVEGADLIVIATPAALVVPTLDAIHSALPHNALITDVASTKGEICAYAQQLWPSDRPFVGSHPMAGSEKFGPEHGRPDFYHNSVCLVEQSESLRPGARDRIAALWEALGARVHDIRPEAHDRLLAHTSHLPHIYAAAIAQAALKQGDLGPFIGNGFRDMTRIAASRPEIWRDISMTNRAAILEGLEAFQAILESFRADLAAEKPEALEAFFAQGQAARREAVPE